MAQRSGNTRDNKTPADMLEYALVTHLYQVLNIIGCAARRLSWAKRHITNSTGGLDQLLGFTAICTAPPAQPSLSQKRKKRLCVKLGAPDEVDSQSCSRRSEDS